MRRLLSRLVFIGFCAALCGELLWRGADALFPFPDEELGRPYGQIVVDRKGDVIRMFLAADGRWRFAVHREQMSPELMEAIVASEDRWFRYHPGVNPVSVLRATFSNLRAGRVVSGASTIPMQIARLMQRRPRTLRSKLIEAFRALQMCRLLEKDELLEIYLNLAPYGDNIEGVRAASYFYFGKRPDRLSWAEIALLTTLPRSPIRYDPTRNPELSRRSRNRVIEQLRMGGLMSPSQSRIARSAAVPGRKRQTPFRAPHFAEFLRRRSPGLQDLKSTLDLEIQASVELGVESHVEQLRALGIENAAVVVLDNNTREVLALVGSAAYLDSAHQGQVNGAVARRSPGSALKPFLYALAYDRGHIVPESLLLDVPYDYSGYVPENYDQRYRGQVSAEEALVQSLNVPAVHLLSRTGLVDFHELLLSAGLSTLDRPSLHYGLPLVLGAGEVLASGPGQPVCLPGPGWSSPSGASPGGRRFHRPASLLARSRPFHHRLTHPVAASGPARSLGAVAGRARRGLENGNLLRSSGRVGDRFLPGEDHRSLAGQLRRGRHEGSLRRGACGTFAV